MINPILAGTNIGQALDILHRFYPGVTPTSTTRDPNSPLGRANPRSYHNVGRAFDVAPIPGTTFGDYVNSLKRGGLNVVEALDEQKHPLPHTTGPNWHIAFGDAPVPQSSYYPPRKPTLASIAAPDLNTPLPVNLAMEPQTLGDIAMPSLPQGDVPKHKGLFPGKDWVAIAGILGDALRGYGGQEPLFAPLMMKRREAEEDRAFDREKLQAEIDARTAKLNEPPQFIQNLAAYMQLPDETKRQYLSYLDATNPIAVSGPQGTQRVPRSLGPKPGTVEDGYIFLGGDPADQNNWRPK